MDTLYLDLTEDATRRHILEMLEQEINPLVRERFKRSVEALPIGDGDHYHNVAEVHHALEILNIEEEVLVDSKAVYTILAEAEAKAHGCAVEETHFHEVGNGEALRCIVAICMAVQVLHPRRIVCSAVQTGHGKVQCAHGLLDIPAPATAAILDLGVPTVDTREGEWCTPTSAALIWYFVDDFE